MRSDERTRHQQVGGRVHTRPPSTRRSTDMESIPEKTTRVPLGFAQQIRDKDGKVMSRPKMVYDREEGFVMYDDTDTADTTPPAESEDDTLADYSRWLQC